MATIVARKKELEIFNQVLGNETANFLAIYGRRRIGKTYIVENFFKDKSLFFHVTGIQNATLAVQLEVFNDIFCDLFYKGKVGPIPVSWPRALNLLRKQLDQIPTNIKIVLFFDELPWLCGRKSNFLSALEYFWNRYFSSMPNITLIVCGSAASWMIDNIINAKGGLHGRVTREIRMLPFTLAETKEYLQFKGIFMDHKQILELYMCMGGVPRYLSFAEKGKSVAQIIGELCFSFNGLLISEFNNLYRSLFKNYEDHKKIVSILAKHNSGLSYKEIVSKTKITAGGTLTNKLEELKLSGFIIQAPIFEKGEKNFQYILIDEYSLFYLTWMTNVSSLDLQSKGPDYWIKQRNSQNWKSWAGFAFENLCLKHIECIKEGLGLKVIQTQTTKWKYISKKGSTPDPEIKGAQIDLVIDRADSCINLCEIKYYDHEFIIDKEYAKKLRIKKDIFETVTKTKKTTFITLITTFGVKKNDYYMNAVDQDITMEILFL